MSNLYLLDLIKNTQSQLIQEIIKNMQHQFRILGHPHRKTIPVVMPHVHQMIDKAIAGDLSQIPRIHWWSVHLAPVFRRPGGIAEMITNAICRLHGIDLPSWKKDIALCVEVLLESDVDNFCKNYHNLFSVAQETFKEIFQKKYSQLIEHILSRSTIKTPRLFTIKSGNFTIINNHGIAIGTNPHSSGC